MYINLAQHISPHQVFTFQPAAISTPHRSQNEHHEQTKIVYLLGLKPQLYLNFEDRHDLLCRLE